ncbi:MAG: M61 family metallopeptidase [Saprospiraceae bacterium]|nr:M61 family metallopeptidase [Saprospiraceae bacterium]
MLSSSSSISLADLSLLLISIFLSTFALAQAPILYQLELDDINQHELNITVDFTGVPSGPLQVRMPRASPGRYAVHNFAKNVYDVKALNAAGNELPINKTSPQEWEISGHGGYVQFKYTLFGNHGDGTYTGIDNRKLHINMPATFVYGVDMDKRPVELHIDLSEQTTWQVATQLEKLEKSCYRAPNYYYFFDSPTMVGEIDFRRFVSSSNGKEYTIEVAMMHEGTDKELDNYVKWIQQIVEAQKQVYGELPDFDYGRYTFLTSYNPWINRGGMEHRNSTVCSSRGNLAKNASQLIGTISHEFFHAWNIERLRPKSLEPFNFDDANLCGELWFAEGFTTYYDDLILCRTGILTPHQYVHGLTRTLNYVYNAPGRQYRNPIEMSYNAPFVDAATANDETNFANNFISYYSYGAVLALCLDLTIRKTYEGKSLDDVMKYLWQTFGKTEIPYEIPDLQAAIAAVTGDKAFAKAFFQQYIHDSQLPDLAPLLSHYGLVVAPRSKDQATFRARIEFEAGRALIKGNVPHGGALHQAGCVKGDVIQSINGHPITNPDQLEAVTKGLKVGNSYPIQFVQNGMGTEGTFTAQADPRFEIMLGEQADTRISKESELRRQAWLKK